LLSFPFNPSPADRAKNVVTLAHQLRQAENELRKHDRSQGALATVLRQLLNEDDFEKASRYGLAFGGKSGQRPKVAEMKRDMQRKLLRTIRAAFNGVVDRIYGEDVEGVRELLSTDSVFVEQYGTSSSGAEGGEGRGDVAWTGSDGGLCRMHQGE
jgi:hypothetical protein